MVLAAEGAALELPKYKYYQCGPPLDQGYTSECVAYSCGQLIEAGPVRQNIFTTDNSEAYLRVLYDEAQLLDEWEGNDYDGTSVRAGMKVLQARKLITSYQWAWDVETILEWVLTVGPVVMGTDWYTGMMRPTLGFIEPTGRPEGGHAWLIIGANIEKKGLDGNRGAFRMINSWGGGWGDNGRAWVSFASVHKLLENWGEAAMSREIRPKAVEEP
jgi:hypothetical protein